MHFQFDYLSSVRTYDIIFAVVRYIIKHLSVKQPDLYYFEIIKMASQAKSYSPYKVLSKVLQESRFCLKNNDGIK